MDWSNLQPVEGFEHLYRDKRSGAIINMDVQTFENERKRKKIAQDRLIKEQTLTDKVESLENDITEIKAMLIALTEKTSGKSSQV